MNPGCQLQILKGRAILAAMDFGQNQQERAFARAHSGEIGREITKDVSHPERNCRGASARHDFGVSARCAGGDSYCENEGLVETRQGVGAFAQEIERRQSLRIEQGDLANREVSGSVQLRIPLEVEAARLAAIHHTPQELGR